MNSTMAQPRREAMVARGSLSHLLDNFEDLRRPSSPSGLGPRFSSSSGWMDAPSWIRCELFISRGSHRSKERPNRLRNGLGRPAYPLLGSPRSHLLRVDSSHLLEFMSFTIAPLWMSLSWRYLRRNDRIGNLSLNLHLLCLIPKCMNGLRMDVHEWASNQHGLWSSSFSVLALNHGPHRFMLQNRPKTCKKRSSSKIYVQVWK